MLPGPRLIDPARVFARVVLGLCLVLAVLAGAAGWAADAADEAPAVRAVLFYDPASPESRDLFAFFLPELLDRYGSRLEVSGIDVSTEPGGQAYRAVGEAAGLPPPPDGLPAVLVDDRALVGLLEIARGLGDQFEDLAGVPGAARWPARPELDALLPAGLEDVRARVDREGLSRAAEGTRSQESVAPSTGDRIANALAVVVLVGMVITLVHALTRLRRREGKPGPASAAVLLVVLLAGLGISLYTAYSALAQVSLVCGPVGSCAAVHASEYSKLFGIPMGVLGLGGYLLILATWLIARRLSPQGGGWYWVPWAIALFGLLFSLRLTALEPFVIGATCLWCLGSAVSMAIAFWLLSGFVRTR